MRIVEVAVSGFRGFRAETRLSLAPGFNVVDGRNGVGKSTIFDAVEFALTGQLTKYGDRKAAGETVEDYLWWKGDGPSPSERFVEVTLAGDAGPITVRRTPIEDPDPRTLDAVQAAMIHADAAPPSPLKQLCASSIIRDELIAALSLDLSETDRYALLRQAIGAGDAEAWIERGQAICRGAKRRSEDAKAEVSTATSGVAEAQRRIDEVRAEFTPDDALTAAASRLSQLVGDPVLPPEQLAARGREVVVRLERELREGQALFDRWHEAAAAVEFLSGADAALAERVEAVARARADREALPDEQGASGVLADLVHDLHRLHAIGDGIGPLDGGCPLCAAPHDDASLVAGKDRARRIMDRLDAAAADAARRREAIAAATTSIEARSAELERFTADLADRRELSKWRVRTLAMLGVGQDGARETLTTVLASRRDDLDAARHALRILSTANQNTHLERASMALDDARQRLQRAQDRAAKARRVEVASGALHDAARRAAGETLDLRLQRVLPLMAELYGRLRPHPFWQDIEYSVRGDVRRFLSLQVGDGLNPQFLFSSGQRRATGLAFLLSIHLSLAWSRWRTILLDDPVQHVDDFRTVNLAEVLAQLVASGRQVIVAVEDAALADLLCRRMPVAAPGAALRLTLGLDAEGTSSLVSRRELLPLKRVAL